MSWIHESHLLMYYVEPIDIAKFVQYRFGGLANIAIGLRDQVSRIA